ncbi:hypothetical protein BGI30_00265 [Snodgrassella alvi]|jgi:putative endonuclease|uniref:GIY-YIG nuclease family protein n=1 Tax=Snodgrassella alvi TaxID=1196083 RepID=UPI000C1EE9DF|nr:GIY-YIG nuclease family protein [Snodgrassella alvi]PIT14480.1 hypothetical protein BGI30_00265 [Snodgrassella alvi]PIT56336.1 hypothetical protein BHC59_08630 [Snodgrassella alvi]
MKLVLSVSILAALPPLPQVNAGWVVYLLYCANGAFYCGITNRPTQRWQAHCSGNGARYTRMYPPLQMRLVCVGITKAAAARCEYRLKRLKAADKAVLWQSLEDFFSQT